MKRKNRVITLLVAFLMVFAMMPLGAGAAFAKEISTDQVVTEQGLVSGVTVLDDGTICACGGASVRAYNADGTLKYTYSLPAKCGNICTDGEYVFAAGYMSGHMNELYVLKPGDWGTCKTLYAGQRVQAVETDYDGNLYIVNSTATGSNGKQATKILRAKISNVVGLASGDTISWTKEYQPKYEAPASDGKCYPQGIAIDGKGMIYIADKGSYNGYDGSVDGIYKYNPSTGSVTAMYFTAGATHRLFTWVYDICADDFGTVAVVGRNNYEIAVFEPGSSSADAIVKANGFPEGVGMDKAGNVYFNASNNGTAAKNGLYRINLGHVAVTGISLSAASKSIAVGKSFTLSSTVTPADATTKAVLYSSSNTAVATVSAAGKVTAKKPGTATITAKTVQGQMTATCKVTVVKAENTLSVKGLTASVSYSKVKKASQTLLRSKVIKLVNAGQGTKTYVKSSGNSKITIAKTTGKVTVKKGLAKGTYKVKVKVKAAGNTSYKAATKTVTFTIKVK